MSQSQSCFWSQVKKEAGDAAQLIGEDLKDLRAEYGAVADKAKPKIARGLAATKEFYKDHSLSERTGGMALGAKIGGVYGASRGLLPGAAKGAVVGGILGFLGGKKGADAVNRFIERHDPLAKATNAVFNSKRAVTSPSSSPAPPASGHPAPPER